MRLLFRKEINVGELVELAWFASVWVKVPGHRAEIFLITLPILPGPAMGSNLTIFMDTPRVLRTGIRIDYKAVAISTWPGFRRLILIPTGFDWLYFITPRS